VTETAPAAAHTVMAAEGLSVDSGAGAGGGLSGDLVLSSPASSIASEHLLRVRGIVA